MIIKGADVPEIREEGYPLVMKKVFYRGKHSDDISLTWVKLWGHHKKMVCHASDRAYYIIEGTSVFQVGDDAPGTAVAGDFVFIPKGVPYVFDGNITYVVMNGPAFVPGSDVELE